MQHSSYKSVVVSQSLLIVDGNSFVQKSSRYSDCCPLWPGSTEPSTFAIARVVLAHCLSLLFSTAKASAIIIINLPRLLCCSRNPSNRWC